jgi:hypothetical protein
MNSEMAELIVSRIKVRKKPTALFVTPFGFRLKSPSQMTQSDRCNLDYIGTYTTSVTVEQISEDCA